MAVTGQVAPRVVVRPPNVPAPPPISLLTQGNIDDTDATLIDVEGLARWEGGGGATWLDPLKEWNSNQVWQVWPDGSGSASTNKSSLSDGTDPGIPNGLRAVDQAPVQRPLIASMIITQGALTDWALRNSVEGDIRVQLERALDCVLPRVIERELWTSAEAGVANWANQFRLKTPNVVATPNTTKLPYLRALARAEQLAADYELIDLFGGAFIHVTPYLASLLASDSHGLIRSPSGRQITTFTGCQLVPEPGATGSWTEAGTSFISARTAGTIAGNNTSEGWLFVTPPVRVRLGAAATRVENDFGFDTNDRTLLVERAFQLEAAVVASHPTSIAVPVDYTTSGA